MRHRRIYKIVVAEDEPIILDNIKDKIVNTGLPFMVAGDAFNGLDALNVIESKKPEVVITDIRMPIMDGLRLIKEIKERYPDTHIVIISGYNEFDYARQAIRYGVKDYLLKPISTDSLKDVLLKIYDELEYVNNTLLKSALISAVNSQDTGCSIQKLSNCSFFLSQICIGNKCDSVNAQASSDFYGPYMNNIDWDDVFSRIIGDGESYWVLDERHCNEKITVMLATHISHENLPCMLEMLLNSIRSQVKPLHVTIIAHRVPVPLHKMWSTTKDLRTAMSESLIPWKSSVRFLQDQAGYLKPEASIIDTVTDNKIVLYAESGSTSLLEKLLYDLFSELVETECTQKWFEKLILQLVKVLHRKAVNFPEAEASRLESELLGSLVHSESFSHFYRSFWSIIDNLLFKYGDTDSSRQLIDDVEAYIKSNFTEQISVEMIAGRFNINPSHMTRLFKRYKGKTPVKYLISLRIEEAKKLIRSQPELDFKDISEIVGYTDQHYFSRMFKNIVGKTPSEYREE